MNERYKKQAEYNEYLWDGSGKPIPKFAPWSKFWSSSAPRISRPRLSHVSISHLNIRRMWTEISSTRTNVEVRDRDVGSRGREIRGAELLQNLLQGAISEIGFAAAVPEVFVVFSLLLYLSFISPYCPVLAFDCAARFALCKFLAQLLHAAMEIDAHGAR